MEEILVHLIQYGCGAGTSGRYDCGGRLKSEGVRILRRRGEEDPIHEAHQAPVHAGIVNRRAEHKAIVISCQGGKLIYLIIEHTLPLLRALETANAAAP